MSLGSSSTGAKRSIYRVRRHGHDAAGAHTPAIIFVTVAFGRDRSSSEGIPPIPPVSWSDMVVSGERAVEREVEQSAASVRGRGLGSAVRTRGEGPSRGALQVFICARRSETVNGPGLCPRSFCHFSRVLQRPARLISYAHHVQCGAFGLMLVRLLDSVELTCCASTR